MAIITLTSDMGLKDYYVASVKGAILRHCEDAVLVDITHQVTPFNIAEASFVVKNAFAEFPEGSIHLIAISPEEVLHPEDPDRDILHVACRYKGHYFIGADNGMFSLIFDHEPEELVTLNLKHDRDDATFPAKDVFAKAAGHLARGGTLEVIGKRRSGVRRASVLRAAINEQSIVGAVLYIDAYGNIITNITRADFDTAGKGRRFTIVARQQAYHELDKISQTYSDVDQGDMVALFGASGYLQLAINKGVEGYGGGAARLMGMRVNDSVRIEFEELPQRLSEL